MRPHVSQVGGRGKPRGDGRGRWVARGTCPASAERTAAAELPAVHNGVYNKPNAGRGQHGKQQQNVSQIPIPMDQQMVKLPRSCGSGTADAVSSFWVGNFTGSEGLFGSSSKSPFIPQDNITASYHAQEDTALSLQQRYERLRNVSDSLDRLLKFKYSIFWSHLLFDTSVKLMLDSYLLHSSRRHDLDFVADSNWTDRVANSRNVDDKAAAAPLVILPQDAADVSASISRRVFTSMMRNVFTCRTTCRRCDCLPVLTCRRQVLLVFHRMAHRVESPQEFVSIEAFRRWHASLHLLTPSRLSDICTIYGPTNYSPLMRNIFESSFRELPSLTQQFYEFASEFTKAFGDAADILDKNIATTSNASAIADMTGGNVAQGQKSRSVTAAQESIVLDALCFITDTCIALLGLLNFTPPALNICDLLLGKHRLATALKESAVHGAPQCASAAVAAAEGNGERMPTILRKVEALFVKVHASRMAYIFRREPSSPAKQWLVAKPKVPDRLGGLGNDVSGIAALERSKSVLAGCLVLLASAHFLDHVSWIQFPEGGASGGDDQNLNFDSFFSWALELADAGVADGDDSHVPDSMASLQKGGVDRWFSKWREARRNGSTEFDEARLDFVEGVFCGESATQTHTPQSSTRQHMVGYGGSGDTVSSAASMTPPSSSCSGAEEGLVQQIVEVLGSGSVGRAFALKCLRHFNGSVEQTLNALLDESSANLPPHLANMNRLDESHPPPQQDVSTRRVAVTGGRIDDALKRQILSFAVNDTIDVAEAAKPWAAAAAAYLSEDEFDDSFSCYDHLRLGGAAAGANNEDEIDDEDEDRRRRRKGGDELANEEENEQQGDGRVFRSRGGGGAGNVPARRTVVTGGTKEARRKEENKARVANHNRRRNFERKTQRGM